MTATFDGTRKTPSETDSEDEVSVELHEKLDEVDLVKIHNIFKREKAKRLNCPQLRKVLQIVAKILYPEQEFEVMFMKMNTARDGFVTWDEFVSYLILGFQQKEIKSDFETLENPIPVPARIQRSNHRYTINRIIFCPTVRVDRTYNWLDGSLITCSRDGTINYWSLDLQFERSVKSSCPNLKVQQTWVTDMVCMPDVSVICTSSSERDLRFYDTSARKFDLRVIFTSVEYAISTMNYHFTEDVNEESKLILGDMGGNIHVIFIPTFGRGPFRSKLGLPLLEVRYDSVVKGAIEGFRVVIFPKQHSEFVRQIMYYPALHGIISCSACPKVGLLLRDLSESKDSYIYKTTKGAWCFAITDRVQILASGSSDCLVKLWNPFVPQYPTATLYGHHAGVLSLILQDDGKRLYSLSQDKCIKVWDIASQTCLQNYQGIPQEVGEHSDLTTLYNPESRQWILGATMLGVIPLSPKQSDEHTDGFTHTAGVSVVLYNPLFKVVVTCGLDSHVIVWNPWDGRRMIAIKEAHTKSVHAEVIPIEITAATFDPGHQRLITGAHDGTLKIWNFNTGTCLRNMKIDPSCEVKCIIWVKNRILTMGWNRRVTEFMDGNETVGSRGEFCKNWDLRHTEDIRAAAVRIPQTLVTATYDGEMIWWRLETGQPYKQYNVSDPTTRIKIQFKPNKQKDVTKDKTQKRTSLIQTRKSVIASMMGRPSITGKLAQAASPQPDIGAKQAALKARRVSTVVMPESCLPMRKLAIHCVFFLQARQMDPGIGTLLVALENGTVQVWSHHISGGFITSFSAIHKAGDYVIAMTSDENNEFLFTGTSIGYIKVWLLKNYCVPDPERISMPYYRVMFPFMWGDLFQGRAARIAASQPKPLLLNSYKGHVMAVSSLAFVDEAKILISSSVDYTSRMWTLSGRYIQTLGTFKPWKRVSTKTSRNSEFEFTIPPDILRVASSTTYRVLRGGATIRKLTFKQMQAKVEKELTHVDVSKIYGQRLKEPILGHYYNPTQRTTQPKEIKFDTSFPHIPVYQHLIMPPVAELKMAPLKTTITEPDYVSPQQQQK